MTRSGPLAAAVGAAAIALAGCGGSSSSSSAPSTAAKPATKGGAVVVDMKNIAFAPKTITVRQGQRIRWDNLDTVDHNVVADSGASFHSSEFGQGGTYEFRATRPGTIQYECTLHPGMTGTIVVR